jgi:lipoyl(octanoyl) transferase
LPRIELDGGGFLRVDADFRMLQKLCPCIPSSHEEFGNPRQSAGKNLISVLQLGTVDYATALRLQEKLVTLRKEARIGDVVLLLEHIPVITLGRNAKSANILASPGSLAQRGVQVFECDRGGDVTFHGPGQLVAYPIFDLHGFPSDSENRKTLGAVEFVRRLEESLIRTCADFGIPAKRIAGLTGVWTGEDPSTLLTTGARPSTTHVAADALVRPAESKTPQSEAKIAALGVHISRGVTSHGIALNVNTDLSFFNLIVPCGIQSKPVTSMQREIGHPAPMQDVAHSLSRNFGLVFQSQVLWLESLDALLGTNLGVPMKPPENLRKLHGEDDTVWA